MVARCPRHPDAEPATVLMASGVHYGKLVCPVCDTFLVWLPKPKDSKAKPKRHGDTAAMRQAFDDLGVDYCQLCFRRRAELFAGLTLEEHHVIEKQDGGGDELTNGFRVCTTCHRIIHALREGRRISVTQEQRIERLKRQIRDLEFDLRDALGEDGLLPDSLVLARG